MDNQIKSPRTMTENFLLYKSKTRKYSDFIWIAFTLFCNWICDNLSWLGLILGGIDSTFHSSPKNERITNRFILLAVNLQKKSQFLNCRVTKINIGLQYVYARGKIVPPDKKTIWFFVFLLHKEAYLVNTIYWLNESFGLQSWYSTLTLNLGFTLDFAIKKASCGSVDFFIHESKYFTI